MSESMLGQHDPTMVHRDRKIHNQADIVGINATLTSGAVDQSTFDSMTAEATDEKVDIVRAAAGDRLDHIEMNIRAFLVSVTEDVDAALEGIAAFTGSPTSMISESPFALVGPPSKLAEDLIARRERWGFSYVIVGPDEAEAFAHGGDGGTSAEVGEGAAETRSEG